MIEVGKRTVFSANKCWAIAIAAYICLSAFCTMGIVGAGSVDGSAKKTIEANLPDHFPKTEKEYFSLVELMEGGMHPLFTFVSFTVWHDAPLDDDKYYAVEIAAKRMNSLARTLNDYEDNSKLQHNPVEFKIKAVHLTRYTEILEKAAREHEFEKMKKYVIQIENSCTGCHVLFNKNLRTN